MIQRLRGIRRRFRLPWRTASQIEREVDEELEFHLTMCIEALERRGLSPEAARREALCRFGDFEQARRRIAAASGRRAGGRRSKTAGATSGTALDLSPARPASRPSR